MRFISTKIHGMLDYLFAIILLISPWIFGFSDNITARWVAITCGIGIIIYSLITRYELSHWKLLPIKVHLWFDGLLGLFLVVTPWFFGFSEEVVTPFVVFGVIAVVVPLLTKTRMAIDQPIVAGGEYVPVYGPERHVVH